MKYTLIGLIQGIGTIGLWPIYMLFEREFIPFNEFMEKMGWRRIGKWTWDRPWKT